MTTLLSREALHADVGHAFNELLALHQLSILPEDSRLRVLQSLPAALLREALETQKGAAGGRPSEM